MKKNKFVKSPLNYTGGKYKLLEQIVPLFPNNMSVFVDLFGGGFNVGANIDASKIVYNELDENVFDIIHGIYEEDTESSLVKFDSIIETYDLNKTNQEGFLKLRDWWNEDIDNTRSWHDLYMLVCHSFNYSFRFNRAGDFNMPFGKNRSEFTKSLRKRFYEFSEHVKYKNVSFYNSSFEKITDKFIERLDKDKNIFFYVDSPYLIATATYNEQDGWNEDKERLLYSELDKVHKAGGKFAVSNVIEHKGRSNDIVKEWMAKYNVHYLNYDYKNCSYHGKNTDKPTIEVLITNY